jgi:hypothetical protein
MFVNTSLGTSQVLPSGGPADISARRKLPPRATAIRYRDFMNGNTIAVEGNRADIQIRAHAPSPAPM